MKIVYMGTPDFAVGALEALIEAGHEITAVVTQPDRPKGRGKGPQAPPVKECALRHGIPVFQPERIKRPEEVERLRRFPADIYVVAAFGQILSGEILKIPPYGCVNIHASLLPKYRGGSPIQQAVIDGEEKTGVTIIQMDEGIDTGDILYRKVLYLDKKETGDSLFEKLAALGARAIVETLPLLERGKLSPVPQDGEKATYVKMIDKADGLIDWNRPAAEIERLVRGLNSWPSAYTTWNGKQLKIWESGTVPAKSAADGAGETDFLPEGGQCKKPGTVCSVFGDTFGVATGDGVLYVSQVQLEGKKRMSVHDFLLGSRMGQGDCLGT